MKITGKIGSCVFLTWLIFVACASKESTRPAVPQERIASPGAPAKQGWQEEWEKTLAMAKKERKVVIFVDASISPTVRESMMKEFKNKYNIDIEAISGRGVEIREKLLSQQRAGLNTGDLFISGLTTLYLVLESAGALEPVENQLFLSEVTNSTVWFEGRLPWFNKTKTIFSWRLYPEDSLWVNTTMIKPGEIGSYRDVLKPQWKGRKFILNDPTVSGPGSKWFEVNIYGSILDVEFMKALAQQDPVLTRDLRLGSEWVAQGTYPFSIGITLDSFEPFVTAGAHVGPAKLKETSFVTSGAGNLSWIKGSPQPAAAKLFANWFLSREGQELAQRVGKMQSSREDIDFEATESGAFRMKGAKYFSGDTEEIYKDLPPIKKLELEIFGPLVK